MDRRGFVRVCAAGTVAALVERPAWASVALAVGVDELVRRSRHVIVAEPLDAESIWERVGQRRHIVTYTRVRTLDALAGDDPQSEELLLRTLGGQVGKLAELVPGEAVLRLGERSVLFATPVGSALALTAMAQGHYPLARDQVGAERLRRSPQAGELLREERAAVRRLPGLSIADARTLFRQVRP
jgi:hypothetical protein